jgi:small-conductance mechanosensitive channel
MSIIENLKLYFMVVPKQDLTFSLVYVFLFLITVSISSWLLPKKLKTLYLNAVIYSLEAVGFTIGGLYLCSHLHDTILKLIVRDFSIFFTAILLAKAVFSFSSPRPGFLKYLSYISLTLSLLVELFILFSDNLNLLVVLVALRKALILLALYPVIKSLIDLITSSQFKKLLNLILAISFVIIAFLWELGKINFDIEAFVGLGIIITSTLAYAWFTIRGTSTIEKFLIEKLSFSEEDSEELLSALHRFLFLILIYIYWLIGTTYLSLSGLIPYLKNWIIIDSELIHISAYNLLTALYLFFTFYYGINVVKKLFKLLFPKEKREYEGASLEAVIYNLGILIDVIFSLYKLGLTWKVLLPMAGALGIGLGFGLQTILNNYVSGFILMFSRNIKVGDFVELTGTAGKFVNINTDYIFGKIEDIGILTTRIKTMDGIDILVPNSVFLENQIVNYSFRNPLVRIRIPFGVAYSSDIDKVKNILLEIANECPWKAKFYKKPAVWFKEMADSALIFELLVWVDIRDIWKPSFNTNTSSLIDWFYSVAFKRFKEEGIEIPFPQNDIWFRNSLKVKIEKNH